MPSEATYTAEKVTANPSLLTRTLTSPSGVVFTGRLLCSDDAVALGRYFDGLSETVTGMYGPHTLNSEHAHILCREIDYGVSLRFVIEIGGDIHGYFILDLGLGDKDRARYLKHGCPLNSDECCTFAPSVSDAYLSHGFGSALMPLIMDAAKGFGRRCVVLMGGVREDNPRAQHFYRKFGFELVGEFYFAEVNNLDMVLRLD